MADDKRLGALSQYGGGETLNELLAILEAKGRLPMYSSGVTEKDGYGQFDPNTGKIIVNPLKGATENAITHETQHSVDSGMSKMYAGLSLTPAFLRSPQENAFINMYEKLYVAPSKVPNANEQALGNYRGTGNEMRGHGVGNMSSQYNIGSLTDPEGLYKLPSSHIDATAAQEAAIMRDLYSKTKDTSPRTIQDFGPRIMNYLKYRDPFGDTAK
jgi:hypothetical protein